MLDRRRTYSVIVTCSSILLAAMLTGAAAGWGYLQSARLSRLHQKPTPTTLAVPKQMPTVRPVELPAFDPDAYLAAIQAGSSPVEVASSWREAGTYRVKWVIDGWLSTGEAWGHFVGSKHELAMDVPKGMKVGDRMDSAARFVSYQLTPSGGMMFSFTALDR